MGGHFFCLPIADGECKGSTAPIFGLPYSFFAAKYARFLLSIGKNDLAPFCIFVILHFCNFDDVPSSKELTLGLPQINSGILSLNRSFVILCFCIFAFCKCETASVRQLKKVSLRSLTRIFDES